MSVSSCIFCRIANHEIPAEIIYDDEDLVVFLDTKPVNKGHALVVPKAHTDHMLQTKDEILHKMTDVVRRVTPAILQAVGAEGFNLHVNTGAAAGQVIFHLHWHIIPRFSNDGKKLWPQDTEYAQGEAEELGKKIHSLLE